MNNHMDNENNKPNWHKISEIKKPQGGVLPGCWEEGRMVGYSQAILDIKNKLHKRIDKCEDIIKHLPEGWETLKIICEGLKAELELLHKEF
jgi:hypothetical protein